jgi:hypothetical protein
LRSPKISHDDGNLLIIPTHGNIFYDKYSVHVSGMVTDKKYTVVGELNNNKLIATLITKDTMASIINILRKRYYFWTVVQWLSIFGAGGLLVRAAFLKK